MKLIGPQSMTHINIPYPARQRPRRTARQLGGLLLRLAILGAVLVVAGCPVAYLLWPRWPDHVALDAPTLPITVGGLAFNVPPAAIRVPMQRRTGAQERLDLVFLWPSLVPPDPAIKLAAGEVPKLTDRIFITVAVSDGAMPPVERFKQIYPRYTSGAPTNGPDGLLTQRFRNDTPFQNEDLFYVPDAPERFLLRCTRTSGPAPGICLHEQRIANTDVTVRFPREWLDNWKTVAADIGRLIDGLRSSKFR
jgi:hypothetical protein